MSFGGYDKAHAERLLRDADVSPPSLIRFGLVGWELTDVEPHPSGEGHTMRLDWRGHDGKGGVAGGRVLAPFRPGVIVPDMLIGPPSGSYQAQQKRSLYYEAINEGLREAFDRFLWETSKP